MNQPRNLKAVLTTLPLDWQIRVATDTGQPITEESIQAAQNAQKYENRERIPEGLLWMADLYNELTGQEPTKRVYTDWLLTFEEWKQERLEADHIRAAWIEASDINKGFHVGRPGALTTVAVSVKSRNNKTSAAQINAKAVEQTKQMVNEKWTGVYVPRPANIERPKNLLPHRRMR